MIRCRAVVIGIFLVLLCGQLARAQALVDHVPADAVVYVGWKGADSLGAAYEQSHLKAIHDSSGIDRLLSDSLPKLIHMIDAQSPGVEAGYLQAMSIVKPMWSHASALYIGPLVFTDPKGPPQVRLALMVDAGGDADAMLASANQLIGQIPRGPVQLQCKKSGTLVVISTFDLPEQVEKNLAQSADFQDCLKQVMADPSMFGYIDGVALNRAVEEAVQRQEPDAVGQKFAAIRDQLGLQGLKHIVTSEGFDGRDWVNRSYIDAPSPRTGLLAMLDGPAVTPQTLKQIPVTASRAVVFSLDVNQLLETVRQVTRTISPEVGNNFQQGLDYLHQQTGVDIGHDLFAAMGAQWTLYQDDATAGIGGGLGFVALNHPRDAATLSASLDKLEAFTKQAVDSLGESGPKFKIRHIQMSDLKVTALPLPAVEPCWTMKDGTWCFAMYPEMLAPALAPGDGKSILDNPAFAAASARLALAVGDPRQITAMAFIDLPRLAPSGYQEMLTTVHLLTGIGDLFGLDSPPVVLPPLKNVMAELTPALSLGWVDDRGWHGESLESFPGSQAFQAGGAGTQILMAEYGTIATFVLPRMFHQEHATANRVKQQANLRQLGRGLMLYCSDHKGAMPPSLADIMQEEEVSPDALVTPGSGVPVPPMDQWGKFTLDQKRDWIEHNSPVVYVRAAENNAQLQPMDVVFYAAAPDSPGSVNACFGDGHVELLSPELFQHYLHPNPKQMNEGGGL